MFGTLFDLINDDYISHYEYLKDTVVYDISHKKICMILKKTDIPLLDFNVILMISVIRDFRKTTDIILNHKDFRSYKTIDLKFGDIIDEIISSYFHHLYYSPKDNISVEYICEIIKKLMKQNIITFNRSGSETHLQYLTWELKAEKYTPYKTKILSTIFKYSTYEDLEPYIECRDTFNNPAGIELYYNFKLWDLLDVLANVHGFKDAIKFYDKYTQSQYGILDEHERLQYVIDTYSDIIKKMMSLTCLERNENKIDN